MSWSAPTARIGRTNRPKGQGHRKSIPVRATGAPGDDRSDSFIPTEGSHVTSNRDNRSSRHSFLTLSRNLEDIANENENPDKSVQDVTEEGKELVQLRRKLSDMEADKAAGFPATKARHTTVLAGESSEESHHTYRKICQESRMDVPEAKTYSGLNYAQYQSFTRSCEHLFCTRPTTYRKDAHKVLYGIGLLEGSASTSWYRYEEGYGRLDSTTMSWDGFKTFLLGELL